MASPKKSVLIISFSEIRRDPRVSRQVSWLLGDFDVTVAGFGGAPTKVEKFVSIDSKGRTRFQKALGVCLLLLRCFGLFYWSDPRVRSAAEKLKELKFDFIVANDVDSLPLALSIAGEAKVIVDAHEYAPREYEDSWRWRLLFKNYKTDLCAKYLGKSRAMFTVCPSIAEEYGKQFGVSPVVITNSPNYQEVLPSPVQEGRVRIIHHGAAVRSRHIEDMIRMFEYLDERFCLDLMLVSIDDRYVSYLKELARPYRNITFVPPVPMESIVNAINGYDIGLYLLPPVNFNHAHALPNKFFEYVQARLAIAVGPSPEMARLVKLYGLGVVADSFEPRDLALKLNALTFQDIDTFKQASHRAAGLLCAEANSEAFLEQIRKLASIN